MKKQLLIYGLFVAIGFILYPLICRKIPEPVQVVNPITMGPNIPDTVYIDKYVYREVPKYIQKIIKDTILVEKIKKDSGLVWNPPEYLSKKLFSGPYFKSDISAWSLAPVDSFKLIQDISWEKYMHDVYKPILDAEKRKSNLTYLTIGTLTGISIASISILILK